MFRYDRLDELIRETGKKKIYLCKKINKCPTYLRDAKKQNTNIKGEDLLTLAAELGVVPEYLTGETDEKIKTTDQVVGGLSDVQKELIRLYDLASPDLRLAALAVLRSAEADGKVQDAGAKDE